MWTFITSFALCAIWRAQGWKTESQRPSCNCNSYSLNSSLLARLAATTWVCLWLNFKEPQKLRRNLLQSQAEDNWLNIHDKSFTMSDVQKDTKSCQKAFTQVHAFHSGLSYFNYCCIIKDKTKPHCATIPLSKPCVKSNSKKIKDHDDCYNLLSLSSSGAIFG